MVKKRYLTEQELSELISIPCKTLQRHRMNGEGPTYIKYGRSIRYPIQELALWLTSCTHQDMAMRVRELSRKHISTGD